MLENQRRTNSDKAAIHFNRWKHAPRTGALPRISNSTLHVLRVPSPFFRLQKQRLNLSGLANAPWTIAAYSSVDFAGASCAEIFRRTSKMSHDGIWHAACLITIRTTPFLFGTHEVARGVTDVGVGSGALLGLFRRPMSSSRSTISMWTTSKESRARRQQCSVTSFDLELR
jgi:hypothetical protein